MNVENEFKMLKTFYISYFIGKRHLEEDGAQNHLVFRPMYRYFNISDYPTLENCLFSAVSLTINADINRHDSFSFPGTELGSIVIIFIEDMISSAKIDNRKKIF